MDTTLHPRSQAQETDAALRIGRQTLTSRLILGSGRFTSFEVMQQAHTAAKCDCVTVAVRRERLHDSQGRNILDFLDPRQYKLLPNTAGCYDATSAIRHARLGREILQGLGCDEANWVKLEVIGDSRTLLPHPLETLKATETLVGDGFEVLAYTSDDPVMAHQLQRAGAVAVMPAGSPIGSGQGLANPVHLQIILEQLKGADEEFPVIVDAGLGTASDVVQAMELGADAVLLNSAVARAGDPVGMAAAMRRAVEAGRGAFLARRMPKSLYGSASSPEVGTFCEPSSTTTAADHPQSDSTTVGGD